jgi:hypothetical protein
LIADSSSTNAVSFPSASHNENAFRRRDARQQRRLTQPASRAREQKAGSNRGVHRRLWEGQISLTSGFRSNKNGCPPKKHLHRSFAVDHTPLMTAPDLVICVIVEAARESLSLAPLQMLGEPKWTAADPQLNQIRK